MAKVLVVGSGGREHAIAYKFHKESHEVHIAGINPAVEEFGVCVALTEDQIPSYAKTNSIDLVFVGPEVPLVNGLVDELQKVGVRAFGPSKLAAQLEGSKVFSKMMMRKYNIPTAKYESFNEALIDLENDRIDALLIDKVYANYYLKQQNKLDDFNILNAGFESEAFAVGARKADITLVNKINEAFHELYREGAFQKIANKWFGEDVATEEVKSK